LDIKCYERKNNSYGADQCVVWASFGGGGLGGTGRCVQAQSNPSVQLKDAEC
jgi:hypothetical protein